MKKLLFVYFLGWGLALAQKPLNRLLWLTTCSTADCRPKRGGFFCLGRPCQNLLALPAPRLIYCEGLPLSEISEADRQNLQLTEKLPQRSGYHQMQQIIDLENYLAVVENNPKRDPKSTISPFMGLTPRFSLGLVFEGHHISLNFTITAKAISFAPAFGGPTPASSPTGPKKEISY